LDFALLHSVSFQRCRSAEHDAAREWADYMKAKSTQIQIRTTEFEKNRIKILADKYAGGNISAWILYGALNAPRKFLKKEKN
jgi:hypothetical protein